MSTISHLILPLVPTTCLKFRLCALVSVLGGKNKNTPVGSSGIALTLLQASSPHASAINNVSNGRKRPTVGDLAVTMSGMQADAQSQASKSARLERDVGDVRRALSDMETKIDNRFDAMFNAISSLQPRASGQNDERPAAVSHVVTDEYHPQPLTHDSVDRTSDQAPTTRAGAAASCLPPPQTLRAEQNRDG